MKYQLKTLEFVLDYYRSDPQEAIFQIASDYCYDAKTKHDLFTFTSTFSTNMDFKFKQNQKKYRQILKNISFLLAHILTIIICKNSSRIGVDIYVKDFKIDYTITYVY